MLLPVDFSYWACALVITANGIGSGMIDAHNSSLIMSSVPAQQRGVASGMRSTFQNSGTALSIGVFFSRMIAGLANNLPKTSTSGLQHQGVPQGTAHHIGTLPPVSSLFAAVLGVNLQDLGVTQIVRAGDATSVGVESTARSDHEHGYHVVLAIDAMTDADAGAHHNSIERIFPRLGETATTSEVLDMLENTR